MSKLSFCVLLRFYYGFRVAVVVDVDFNPLLSKDNALKSSLMSLQVNVNIIVPLCL